MRSFGPRRNTRVIRASGMGEIRDGKSEGKEERETSVIYT